MRAFLDIDIGDAKQYADELEAFRLTTAFYDQVGSQVAARTLFLTLNVN